MRVFAFTAMVLLCALSLVPFARGAEWTLSTQLSGTGADNRIAAADENHVWSAVCSGSTVGPIYFFNGSDWSFQTALFTAETGELRGIYAYDDSHVWAVGNTTGTPSGRLFFFDGTSWSRQTGYSQAGYVYAAYAATADDIWVASSQNIKYSDDGGASWTIQTTVNICNAIHGLDSSHVWAVGGANPARIYYLNGGTSWTVQTAVDLSTYFLRSIHAIAEDDVWAGGDTGIVLHYDGEGEWSVSTVLSSGSAKAFVSAAGPDPVWAGASAGIYRYDDPEWAVSSTITAITGIDATVADRVWAINSFGRIYYLSLSEATPTPPPVATATPPPVATATPPPVATATPPPVATATPLTPTPIRNNYHTDFNGDGTSDIAVFRASSGLWAIRGITRVYFGGSYDQPVPADYSGEGTTEVAVFRDSSGLWAVRGVTRVYFGQSADLPRPGDYNGDGKADPALFRPAAGLWAIRGVSRVYFGASIDLPAPGYYASGNDWRIAIFRGSSGLWAVRGVTRVYFGQSADTPRPGDYTGDGIFEPAVFRPATGLWAVRGVTRAYFGSSIDSPVPGDYSGEGSDLFGIYRFRTGLWAVRGMTRIYFGTATDLPVTR